jgi:hypothetical protein
MQQYQMLFLSMAPLLLFLGVVNLFFTERFFYWGERRTYAYPLEPSSFKLRKMRLGGVLQVLGALCLAYVGIAGR